MLDIIRISFTSILCDYITHSFENSFDADPYFSSFLFPTKMKPQFFIKKCTQFTPTNI